MAAVVPTKPSIAVLDDLAPGGSLEPLLAWTRSQAPADVAWVGHAPDVESLAADLVGAGHGQIGFEKGAVAAIRLAGPVDGRARASWSGWPRPNCCAATQATGQSSRGRGARSPASPRVARAA